MREIKRRRKDTKPRTRRSGAYKGIHINNGYLFVYFPTHPNAHGAKNLYFPLHRLVMEWKLGRRLTSEEVVHHLDEDTLNNHPDNLVLMTASEHNKLTARNRNKNQYGQFS